MAKVHYIRLGTSEPQDFALKDDGDAIDGTGIAIALAISRQDGAAISSSPTVAWLVESAGTVRVSAVDGLTAGSYKVRYKLTDGSGKISYVPNGKDPDIWQVVNP